MICSICGREYSGNTLYCSKECEMLAEKLIGMVYKTNEVK